MTSSYYAGLGKAAVGLPDISKTNYMQTEPDMVGSVNTEIDRVQDLDDKYFNDLISYYNHELEKKTPGEQAVKTLTQFTKMAPDFLKDKKKVDKWFEFRKEYKKFSDLRFSDKALNAMKDGKIQRSWILQDPVVRKYAEVEPEMNDHQRTMFAQAKIALAKGDVSEARKLFKGLNEAFVGQIDVDRTSISLLGKHETVYRPLAEAGMKVWIPWLNDYRTYNEVLLQERERLYIDQVIDSYFAFRHEDVFRGRQGKFKSEFVTKLLEREKARTLKTTTTQTKAIVDDANKSRGQDLHQRIKIDKGYLPKFINIYSGQFSDNYNNPSKRISMNLARNDAFRLLGDLVTDDPSSIPDVEAQLVEPFQAFDGQITTAEKLWEPQVAALRKKIKESRTAETEARANEKIADDESAVQVLLQKADKKAESGTPWTAKERMDEITNYMRSAGITDPQKVPDRIKRIAYAGKELDEDIDYRLQTRLDRGEEITYADLGAISDPIMLDKWRKAIVDNAGAGLNYDQVTNAKGAINAEILNRLNIKDITKAKGNPIYEANKENAYDAYLAEWNRVKRAQPGISDRDAHRAAMDKVSAGVNKLVPGSQVDYIWDKRLGIGLNQDLKTDVNSARTQIRDDNSLLLSETPLDGEAPYLEQAVKYINTTNAGLPGQLPTYYRMLAKNLPGKYGDPQLLMRARLEANGLLKGNEISIPEYDNLPESQAINLTVNPTSCKTYVQMQNIAASGEDIGWMLDIIQDPTAVKEGGHDYVVGPNIDQGKDAHLPKPLTEHTIGEVLELVNSGHTDLGIYAITGSGFKAIVEANQVPLDIPFNKQTQDLFVLGRLRQKAQQSQNYTTQQDAYRRLVNIRPEDNEEFLKIVGDLPPFLQLSNMIPICSTELVNQTLQR